MAVLGGFLPDNKFHWLNLRNRLWVAVDTTPAIRSPQCLIPSEQRLLVVGLQGDAYITSRAIAGKVVGRKRQINLGEIIATPTSGDTSIVTPQTVRPLDAINSTVARLHYEPKLPLQLQDKAKQKVVKEQELQASRPVELLRNKHTSDHEAIQHLTDRLYDKDFWARKEERSSKVIFEKERIRYEERLRFFKKPNEVVIEDEAFVRRYYEVPKDRKEMAEDQRERQIAKIGPPKKAITGVGAMIERLSDTKRKELHREALCKKLGIPLVEKERRSFTPGPLSKKATGVVDRMLASAKAMHERKVAKYEKYTRPPEKVVYTRPRDSPHRSPTTSK